MIKLTKQQQQALKSIYERSVTGKSYIQLRRYVCGTFGCNGAVTVSWCGMCLCIERDGYIHS